MHLIPADDSAVYERVPLRSARPLCAETTIDADD